MDMLSEGKQAGDILRWSGLTDDVTPSDNATLEAQLLIHARVLTTRIIARI
jgi:hypothetical protein